MKKLSIIYLLILSDLTAYSPDVNARLKKYYIFEPESLFQRTNNIIDTMSLKDMSKRYHFKFKYPLKKFEL